MKRNLNHSRSQKFQAAATVAFALVGASACSSQATQTFTPQTRAGQVQATIDQCVSNPDACRSSPANHWVTPAPAPAADSRIVGNEGGSPPTATSGGGDSGPSGKPDSSGKAYTSGDGSKPVVTVDTTYPQRPVEQKPVTSPPVVDQGGKGSSKPITQSSGNGTVSGTAVGGTSGASGGNHGGNGGNTSGGNGGGGTTSGDNTGGNTGGNSTGSSGGNSGGNSNSNGSVSGSPVADDTTGNDTSGSGPVAHHDGGALAGSGEPPAPIPPSDGNVTVDPSLDGIKQQIRNRLLDLSQIGRISPDQFDRAESIVGVLAVSSLDAMDAQGLRSGAVSSDVWSDSYWPTANGLLANRYADSAFPHMLYTDANASADAQSRDAYFNQVTLFPKVAAFIAAYLGQTSEQDSLDNLSPAEKYDMLVGDKSFGLTRRMISEGQGYYSSSHRVESWMGICHGWAPASFSFARPKAVVTLPSADGQKTLNFYPADIKALGSLLFAKVNIPRNFDRGLRFVGRRCEYERLNRSDSQGHHAWNVNSSAGDTQLANDCLFDLNPSTWHLTMVNQVGSQHRSFIMDARNDRQVWNHPIVSYRYDYFNPETHAVVGTLGEAKVNVAQFQHDIWKNYRSAKTLGQATSVAGVHMEVTYRIETTPNHSLQAADATATVEYFYDLELDSSGKPIGGVWYKDTYPDFVWDFAPSVHPWGRGDFTIYNSDSRNVTWNADGAVPAAWLPGAQASSQYGQPLAHVVEALFNKASQ